MFRFTIRDLLFITMIIALALGWWVDRRRLASRAKDADAFQALSESLVIRLKDKNPLTSINIWVNGSDVVSALDYSTESRTTKYAPLPYLVPTKESSAPKAPDKAD